LRVFPVTPTCIVLACDLSDQTEILCLSSA